MAARKTALFDLRAAFERQTDALHESTMRSLRRSDFRSPDDEVAEHLASAARSAANPPSADFAVDLRRMLSARGVQPLPPEAFARAAELLSKKTADVKFADLQRAFKGAGGNRFRALGTAGRSKAAADEALLEAEQSAYWAAGELSARHAFNMAAGREALPPLADAAMRPGASKEALCGIADIEAAVASYAPGKYRLAAVAKGALPAALFDGGCTGLIVVAPGNKHKRRRFCAIIRVGGKHHMLDPSDARKVLHPLKAADVSRFAKATSANRAPLCAQVFPTVGEPPAVGSKRPLPADSSTRADGAAQRHVAAKLVATTEPAGAPTFGASEPLLQRADSGTQVAQRGFVNSARSPVGPSATVTGPSSTRCFAIATAQCLFSCKSVAEYLAQHEGRHRSLGRDLPTAESVARCYACALSAAMRALRLGTGPPLEPHEHQLWAGAAWAAPGPGGARSLEGAFPLALQHAADEYLMAVQPRLRQADDIIAARQPPGPPSLRAPFALRATVRRAAACHECGQRPVVGTHSCDVAQVALPAAAVGDAVRLQHLIDNQAAFAGTGAPAAVACGASLSDGKLCAARVPGGSVATSWEPDTRAGGGRVAVFHFDRALPNGGKNFVQVDAQEHLLLGGSRWRIRAAVRHIGQHSTGGHYVAVVGAVMGSFYLADDSVVRGPMAFADAWGAIGREPTLLFCDRDGQ